MRSQLGFLAPGHGAHKRDEKLPDGRKRLGESLLGAVLGAGGVLLLNHTTTAGATVSATYALVIAGWFALSWFLLIVSAFGLIALLLLHDEYRWRNE